MLHGLIFSNALKGNPDKHGTPGQMLSSFLRLHLHCLIFKKQTDLHR